MIGCFRIQAEARMRQSCHAFALFDAHSSCQSDYFLDGVSIKEIVSRSANGDGISPAHLGQKFKSRSRQLSAVVVVSVATANSTTSLLSFLRNSWVQKHCIRELFETTLSASQRHDIVTKCVEVLLLVRSGTRSFSVGHFSCVFGFMRMLEGEDLNQCCEYLTPLIERGGPCRFVSVTMEDNIIDLGHGGDQLVYSDLMLEKLDDQNRKALMEYCLKSLGMGHKEPTEGAEDSGGEHGKRLCHEQVKKTWEFSSLITVEFLLLEVIEDAFDRN
ncbi:hypothetical protein Pelo_6261 [Pelomyxa schiedti]|nr:hypothetical protein Pelo_6261 [Pelomyxa schiedti]